MKRKYGYIVAFTFVLAVMFCGVLAAEEPGEEKVYLLCRSETGKLKVISTAPDKVMDQLEKLKNSDSGNYTVIVGDDRAEPGYYVISIGDEPSEFAGSIAGRLSRANGDDESQRGGNDPQRWYERLPALIYTEVTTIVMLVMLGWYYRRRKLARQSRR